MNPANEHPLAKYGIMSSFSIGKSISNAKLKRMAKKMNISEDSDEFQESLKNHIIKETQLAIYNNKIPGVITNKKEHVQKLSSSSPVLSKEDFKKRARVALLATLVIQKTLEQKLTTEEQCFLIVKLVAGLGLTEEDFQNFHRKNGPQKPIDDDDEESDD